MTIWLLTRLWLSPAAVALPQLLIVSGLIGLGLARLRRSGVPCACVWVICALFVISPLPSTLTITLWKDIAYGAAVVALTLLVMEIVMSGGAWLNRRASWLMLGGLAALAALYRHNGPLTAFGTLLVLLLAYSGWRRRLLLSLMLAVGLWFVVQGPLYRGVNVQMRRWGTLQPIIFQLAAHVAAGTETSQDEQRYLESVRGLADAWRYDCHSILATLFDGQFHFDVIDRDPWRMAEVWWSLTRRAPWVNVKHVLCNSSLVWQVTQPVGACLHTNSLWIDEVGNLRTIEPNRLGLQEASQLPQLQPFLADFALRTRADDLSWLVWRPALYLYVAVAATAVTAARRTSWRFLLMLLPVGLNALSLAVAAIACDARFHYPTFVVGLLALGWLAVPCSNCEHLASTDATRRAE